MSRGSASAETMEAEPPDMRYQAEPGNEYNHLGLLYKNTSSRVRLSLAHGNTI
jgi:hypothetical protein